MLAMGIGVGGAGGGSATPAGSNTQVQFNNSGAFGANSGFVYNGSTVTPNVTITGSSNTGPQLTLGFGNAGTASIAFGSTGPTITDTNGATIAVSGPFSATAYNSATNCSSSGGTCGSAAAGAVSIAAAASTVTVATTAVTANSNILLTRNDALGTRLAVTCNTATAAGDIKVSTITGGTSFVITVQNAPATNPLCLNYFIVD